jgi:predicted dehydrogenase/threonine dehydrogenase-like Zn-dependent dehydrogenase
VKAVLQNVKTGEISVDEIPTPVLGKGAILVRNSCSLVSAGTEKAVMEFSQAGYLKKALLRPDLFRKVLNRARNEGLWETYKVVNELIEQKIPLGYSSAGTVIACGSEVHDLKVGDRVACAGLFLATHSEYVSIPRNLAVPVPAGCELEEACFVTLGAIALQGVRLAEITLGENVIVYGLGLVGMVTAQLAIAAGAKVIGVDVDPEKIKMLKELGCPAFAPDDELAPAILAETNGYGADKVLLCAATKSNDPIERIPALTRQKGVLVVVGDVSMNIPRRAYYDREIDIRISRSYGPGRYDLSYEQGGIDYPYAYVRWTENRNMQAVLDLVARKKLDLRRMVTHRFKIEQAGSAYELIEGKKREPFLGVVIEYAKPEERETLKPRVLATGTAIARPHGSVIRMGILGAGNFGKAFLLPAFARQREISFQSICTASGVSAASVARKYSIPHVASNPEEIFERGEIDAIMIATRHDTHAEYVCRALEAGKAVYVEKPLALTDPQLDRVRDVYQAKSRDGKSPFLMVGFNRRFSPLSLRLKETFAGRSEPLTIIYRVNAGPLAEDSWHKDPMQGGGRVLGEACHFIDYLSFLVGAAPTWVSAASAGIQHPQRRDTLTITLGFADGSLGTIHYFSNGDPTLPKEYCEIYSGGVTAQLRNFRSLKIYGKRATGKTKYLNQVKGFPEESRAFAQALSKGGPSPIPFDELYQVSKATLRVSEALTSGGRVDI